jgi:hypothetical protein
MNVSPDQQFEDELEIFRRESEGASQFFTAFMAIHKMAANHELVQLFLNQTPLFSNTILGALQTASFVALGRVFDQDSAHNIDRVLRLAQDNPEIFSKAALGQRKIGNRAEEPDWLQESIRDAYEPTSIDFRQIRTQVYQKRKIYEHRYRELRNKVFAHNAAKQRGEIDILFANTNTGELNGMFTFFGSLYRALWELFFNGRKLQVSDSDETLRDTIQEKIGSEAEQFLLAASSAIR